MICAILMAFATSYSVVNPGQWYDLNQVTTPLRSVFMLSPTTGWAVGDSGTILYWNGNDWSRVQSPTTSLNLYSVFFPDVSNPNDGWIVGQTDASFPAILHWDGVAWVKLGTTDGLSWTTGQVGTLYGLFFLTPSDGWAVGAPGSSTNIVHWSGRWGAGGSWTTRTTPDNTATLYSLQVLSNTATPLGGYAVGGKAGPLGVIFSWDGATWSSYAGVLPAANLRSISMISPTDAWAVGDAPTATPTNPVAIRLSGTTWGGPMSLSALGIRSLQSVIAIDANNAFGVGSLGSAGASDIIKFTTSSWAAISSPATVDLFSICTVPGSSVIWSVGNWGTILRNNAGTWRVLTSPVGAGDLRVPPPTANPPNLNSVHFSIPSVGWAVGNNGSIIVYDGIGWSTYPGSPLVSNNLTSVYTISPSDGYAVGQHGTILRLTSVGWGVVAQCPGPACLQDVTLRSVFELPTGEAWAVGNATSSSAPATILHWLPPGPWSQVPSNTPNGANLTSTFFLADGSEGWAVGTNRTTTTTLIDHWKNGVWTVVTSTPPIAGNLALDSVVIVNNNPSNVWATGTSSSGGAIALHYDGTIWSPSPINQVGLTGWATIGFVPGSTNDAWIVGGNSAGTGGQTLHWDGVTWADIPLVSRPFAFPRFTSVQMLSATDGWAVGYAGHIIRLGPQSFVTTTVTSTSISTTTLVTSTTLTTSTATSSSSTNSSSTTSTTTTVSIPPSPVPGFPIESILVGLAGGLIALTIIRRRRRP